MSDSPRPTTECPSISAQADPPAEPVTPTAHDNLADSPLVSTGGDSENANTPSQQEPPCLSSPQRGRGYVPADRERRAAVAPKQRPLILDAWQRSGLPARDFAPLVGLSRHTLYSWKRRFEQIGPAGLVDQPPGAPCGSKLPELTKRTILLLKQAHSDWGSHKISDLLLRGPALPASPDAVARVLVEAGCTRL